MNQQEKNQIINILKLARECANAFEDYVMTDELKEGFDFSYIRNEIRLAILTIKTDI